MTPNKTMRYTATLLLIVSTLSTSCRAFLASSSSSKNTRQLLHHHLSRQCQQPSSLHAGRQLLEFIEPTTGVTVKLVGAMHYNPTSIALARETIDDLAAENRLGSVVIESCYQRWNATLTTDKRLQKLLGSEMRTAYDRALEYNRPVVLGDQPINITVDQLGKGFQQTFRDLLNPKTGWKALFDDITDARKAAVPFGDGYLNAGAFLDPALLLAAPVSLAKYPLSYVVKSPILGVLLVALVFLPLPGEAMTPLDSMTTSDWIGQLTGSALETVLFARVFLKDLLVDRNEILARNILQQCRLYEKKKRSPWERFALQISQLGQSSDGDDIVYAPGSVVDGAASSGGGGGGDKTVVAVLGMAHLNGIKKLLQEKLVS